MPEVKPQQGEGGLLEPRIIDPSLMRINDDDHAVLMGGRCGDCGAISFPRTPVCASCLSEGVEACDMPQAGTLYAFSVVHQARKNWVTPYAIGYVDLPNGKRVFAHLKAPHDKLAPGMTVGLTHGVVGHDDEGHPLMTYLFTPAHHEA